VSLGEVLRQLMEERDITQKYLADGLKIGPSTLGNYIQNTRQPDYEMLKSIATYFNVSIDYLLEFSSANPYSSNESELLRIFASLNGDQQELLIAQGKLLLNMFKGKCNLSSSDHCDECI